MSSPSEKELKGGHLPAVKAGGMRVARTKKNSTGEAELSSSPKEEEESYVEGPSKSERHTQQVVISGTVLKGDKEFTADAVKQYHNKPEPSKDFRSKPNAANHQMHHIQQPR